MNKVLPSCESEGIFFIKREKIKIIKNIGGIV